MIESKDEPTLEELRLKLDKIENILFSLKTLDHHTLAEEMWRVDNALEIIRN